MKNHATTLNDARFWVRPYEFEGDGSTGAADDVASVEVDGKTRTFWLKRLDGRLFFREVGRDEEWNFGALKELEESDLLSELARVLEDESYGRVLLLHGESRPCFGLASTDGRVLYCVPNSDLSAARRWTPTVFTGDEPIPQSQSGHFLDWKSDDFRLGSTSQLVNEFRRSLDRLPAPIIETMWVRGSHAELQAVMKSFVIHFWETLISENPTQDRVCCLGWRSQTAWQMQNFKLVAGYYLEFRPNTLWVHQFCPILEQKLKFIAEQFLVSKQGEANRKIFPGTLTEKISAPTYHETLEAHLYLRDWINQKLPPDQAKAWLNFS